MQYLKKIKFNYIFNIEFDCYAQMNYFNFFKCLAIVYKKKFESINNFGNYFKTNKFLTQNEQ